MKRKDILEMLNKNTEYISRIHFLLSKLSILDIGFSGKESIEIYKRLEELVKEYHNWKEQEMKSEKS
jgi:benzoyl-CoA reductase/2-hydroxyglutaryl-CoA dehydratase subunit BcrC/BadD/HgdB